MNLLHIDISRDSFGFVTPLPNGFGLYLDIRNRQFRFGSYVACLYEFLDYDLRGETKPWSWNLVSQAPVITTAANDYENWRRARFNKKVERLSKRKLPFVYECWKCPETHLADRMTATEADQVRKLYGIEIRRINWLDYLMRAGQASLSVNIQKMSNKR